MEQNDELTTCDLCQKLQELDLGASMSIWLVLDRNLDGHQGPEDIVN